MITAATTTQLKKTKISSATECKVKTPHLGFLFSKDSLSKHNIKEFLGPYI